MLSEFVRFITEIIIRLYTTVNKQLLPDPRPRIAVCVTINLVLSRKLCWCSDCFVAEIALISLHDVWVGVWRSWWWRNNEFIFINTRTNTREQINHLLINLLSWSVIEFFYIQPNCRQNYRGIYNVQVNCVTSNRKSIHRLTGFPLLSSNILQFDSLSLKRFKIHLWIQNSL